MGLLQRFYGAGAAHLASVVVCLALAGGAVAIVAGDPAWPMMLAWFLAAVVLHDFVLFPLYAAGDRLLTLARARSGHRRRRVPVVNHVRVPVLGAGLTFLLFLPGILGRGDATLRAVSGLDTAPVAGRWLLLVAAMAGASALVYVVRVLRSSPAARRRRRGSASTSAP
jgi:Flp pilus assembly protein protease CpaA